MKEVKMQPRVFVCEISVKMVIPLGMKSPMPSPARIRSRRIIREAVDIR